MKELVWKRISYSDNDYELKSTRRENGVYFRIVRPAKGIRRVVICRHSTIGYGEEVGHTRSIKAAKQVCNLLL